MFRRTPAAICAAVLLTLAGACGPTGGGTPPGPNVPGTQTYDFYFKMTDTFGHVVTGEAIIVTVTPLTDDGTAAGAAGDPLVMTDKVLGLSEADPLFHYAATLTEGVIGATVAVELWPPVASPGDTMSCWVTVGGPDGIPLAPPVSAQVPADAEPLLYPLEVACIAP